MTRNAWVAGNVAVVFSVLFAILSLFFAIKAQAQILCTPLGGGTTFCGGYDSALNDRAFAVTPLGRGNAIIMESTPLPSVSRRAPAPSSAMLPSLLAPSRVERSVLRATGRSLMERAGPTLLDEPWRSSLPWRSSRPMLDLDLDLDEDDELPPEP